MPLLGPITLQSAPVRRQSATHPVIPRRAEDVSSCSLSPSPEARSMTQPLVIPSGVNTHSRSGPQVPSRGSPPTPPSRGPLPMPRSRDSDPFNSLSRRDIPSPPNGPPQDPHRHGVDIPNSLSRHGSPPKEPPSSPRRYGAESYTSLSRSTPPSPPRGPPPTPKKRSSGHSNWTPDETDLLMFVCRSGVKLGWYQIAGLFHGKDVDVCRSKYREIQYSKEVFLEQGDSKSYHEPLQLYIPTDELPPGLSRGPSPMGPPVCDCLIRNWGSSDVECAIDFTIPGKTKTISHLSNELNSALGEEWDSVKGRVPDKHAFSSYSTEVNWTMEPEIFQMAD